jgi:peptidoglycan/LPS O-acetylase OafA/YrhL
MQEQAIRNDGASGWKQLDTARLILAATVVGSHAFYFFLTPLGFVSLAPAMEWLGRYAVLCFFVLSGLVIGRTLEVRHDGFVPFMIRRVGRIYPPLVLSVVLVTAIDHVLRWSGVPTHALANGGPMINSFSYDLREITISLATFGFGGWLSSEANVALWSLVIEMRCYVMAGLLACIFRPGAAVGKAVAAIALLGAIALVATDRLLSPLFALCYGTFAFGLLLSRTVKQIPRVLPEIRVDISYSLYIFHQPIMLGLVLACYRPAFPTVEGAIALGCVATSTAVALAWLSARWVEPFRLQAVAKAYDAFMVVRRANIGAVTS